MYQVVLFKTVFDKSMAGNSQPRTGCKNVKESITNSKTNMKY